MEFHMQKLLQDLNQLVFGFWKRLAAVFLITGLIVLSGCATGSIDKLHGYTYCNTGTKGLKYLKIQYGEARAIDVTFRKVFAGGDKKCLHQSLTTTTLPIQKTMLVEWQTEDGQKHNATIPIRALVTQKHPARSFQARINDEGLQIYQTNFTPPNRDATLIFEK
jgi:hypothetical protein